MEKSQTRVCVTGGSGFIGSSLVKKLLEKGYTVHATLRNLEDKAKVGLLTSLPNAETNLVLFEADIYNPDQFQAAINGCEFVFHVAYPLQHNQNSYTYKDRMEAMAAGSKSIAESCIKSGTVRRLIYTASVMAASPLFQDGVGYGAAIDESCWTPLNVSFKYCDTFTLEYTRGKTVAEKEVLKYNDAAAGGKLEVVSLVTGLVGGDTILSHVPTSVEVIISPATGNLFGYNHGLMLIQELLGSVPLVHVEDACEALVFCVEGEKTTAASLKGRFLCAAGSLSVREIATCIRGRHLDCHVDATLMGKDGKGIRLDNSKLVEMGFRYKYDAKGVIEESLECAKRLGALPDLAR
ncbi:unnamed protein product [Linum trigynum]|uniref:3-beta hydroxysteroid dehydrogenase/isomerase domain-containing protein n=1 Tax=Linum trigynum TaxID=586398 RepID=A0AAV2EKN5_9ROSI